MGREQSDRAAWEEVTVTWVGSCRWRPRSGLHRYWGVKVIELGDWSYVKIKEREPSGCTPRTLACRMFQGSTYSLLFFVFSSKDLLKKTISSKRSQSRPLPAIHASAVTMSPSQGLQVGVIHDLFFPVSPALVQLST